MDNNQHAARAKALQDNPQLIRHEINNLNSSRTIADGQHWIGCGHIATQSHQFAFERVLFPYYSLVIVVDGTGIYVDDDGKSYPLHAGAVFQRIPTEIHSTTTNKDSNWREYYLDCDPKLYEWLCSFKYSLPENKVFYIDLTQSLLDDIESLLARLTQASDSQLPDLFLQYTGLMRDIFQLSNQAESNSTGDGHIDEMLSYFEDHSHVRLDLERYCIERGWGYDNFRKRFKKRMGVSPKAYLIRKRMDRACQMLRSSSQRISQIALELGYSSQYEFSNQFKRHFGVYPKHFRNGVTYKNDSKVG